MVLPAHSEPWWTVTRVSGIAATAALVAAGALGVLLARRLGGQSTRTRLAAHRQLVKLALVMLGIHVVSAFLDRRHVPAYAVVAPFWSPVRRIASGTGSLAMWGLLLVALTAVGRRRFTGSWRVIHRYVSYPAAGLALTHSLLGSDSRALTLGIATCLETAAVIAITRTLVLRQRATHEGPEVQPRRTHDGVGAPTPQAVFSRVGRVGAQTVLAGSSPSRARRVAGV